MLSILLNGLFWSIIGVERCGSVTGRLVSTILSKSLIKRDCRRNGGNRQSDLSPNTELSVKPDERHQKCQGKHPLSVFEPEYKSDALLRI